MRVTLSDPRVRQAVEIGFVGALAALMLWIRWIPAERFLTDPVTLGGTDAWYHLRHAIYSAANFPATLGFDLFTRYPDGTLTGQYGSLFDVMAAGLGLLLGGTRQDIATAGAVLPALLGAATVVPLYLLVKEIWNGIAGAFAGLALALLPGLFLNRSVVGSFDHHIAEAFLSTLFLWLLVRALHRSADLDLGLAAVLDDPSKLAPYARPWGWAALALVAYVLTWPPGILFVAIAATALGGLALVDHLHGRDPRDVQWTGLAVLGGAGVLLLPSAEILGLKAIQPSLLQPLTALVAGTVVFATGELLAWGRDRDLPRWALPAAALVGVPLALWVVATLIPAAGDELGRGMSWVFGIGRKESLTTIAEARSAGLPTLSGQYGLLLLSAAIGALPVAWWTLRDADRGAGIVLVWTVVAFAAGFNQVRFNYYLAVTVAALNGALMAGVVGVLDLPDALPPEVETPEIEWPQIVAVLLVVGFVLPGNVVPTSDYAPAWERADGVPRPSVERWRESLEWLDANTPPEPFDLETTFRQGQSMPEGGYGVMSWWDYGHWITTIGQRVPVANPFQQNAPYAAAWLTNTSEAHSVRMLDDRGEIRYVMIDDQTAAGKWSAVAVWADVPYGEGTRTVLFPGQGEADLPVPGEPYESSTTNRLYGDDAEGMGSYRLVHESPRMTLIGSIVDVQANEIRRFNRVLNRMSPDQARDRFGSLSFDTGDRANELGGGRWLYDAHLESTVKVFEKVPGARLRGTTEPGQQVTATLSLVASTTGRSFAYRTSTIAGSDGGFELTVPYATSEPVPINRGGTRYSVRADGPYAVETGSGNATTAFVPDRTVLDGGVVQVTSGGG